MYAQTFIPSAPLRIEAAAEPAMRHGMVGMSAPLQRLLAQMERIGPYFRTALVTGEGGTGKEMVARGLHVLSQRSGGPFVVCDAAAAAEPLTRFEAARGGTLFLDEVGEVPLTIQARLLHVLHQYRPGSAAARPTDALIVASSSRDLKGMCAAGEFRKDLYYRLALVELKVHPLRDRGVDIVVLSRYFARQFAVIRGKEITAVGPAALAALAAYPWPGNVRELQQVLCKAVMHCTGDTIQLEDLPPLSSLPPRVQTAHQSDVPTRLDEMVHRHVRTVMESCGGNKLRAADLLGISRSTLYRMLEHS